MKKLLIILIILIVSACDIASENSSILYNSELDNEQNDIKIQMEYVDDLLND